MMTINGTPTEESVRLRFLALFMGEHTDGTYHYVILRNTEESPEACHCGTPANRRWVDVEDLGSGGIAMCSRCLEANLAFRSDAEGELFYKPTGHTAEQAWEGTEPMYGWKLQWPLFAAPDVFPSDWFLHLPEHLR